MSAEYHFECPHCEHPKPVDLDALYGTISRAEYEEKRDVISQSELLDFPSLRASAELSIKDGRLIVSASCFCTKCGAKCSLDASNEIRQGETQ